MFFSGVKNLFLGFARCSLQFAYSLHFAFLLTNGRWLGRWRSGAKHSMRAGAPARVTCAPSLGISIFCFHNLHRKMIFPRESRPRALSSAEDFFLEKMKVYSLSSQAKLNTVPNTLVICCEIACYERICEGCESKKSKIAVCARICARERVPPSREKGRENQDEGEEQKREGSGR